MNEFEIKKWMIKQNDRVLVFKKWTKYKCKTEET